MTPNCKLYVHYERNCDISMREDNHKNRKLHYGNRSVNDTQLFKTQSRWKRRSLGAV